MFMFVLNILCHNLLGTNRPEGWGRTKVGTKHLSLGTNRLGTKDPWVHAKRGYHITSQKSHI